MSHVLHLKVVEARNLKAADTNGFSDPYAKIIIHDKKDLKTKIVKKTLNPKWEETYHIEGLPDKGSFVIQVYDWDFLGSDDFLGSVEVAYSAAQYNHAKERWVTLNDETGPQGDVHLVLQVLPKGYKPELENISVSSSRLSIFLSPDVKEGSGQLVVEVISATNLAAKDLNGFSDPYCILKLGKTDYKTNIMERTLNPIWNEEFYFEVTPQDTMLDIELMDWDRLSSHDRMGVVHIELKSLIDEKPHHQSFQVVASKKEKVSGSLMLRMQYTSPMASQKNHQIAVKYYFKLIQVLVIRDVALVVNLLNLYESQELARAIIHLFSWENRVMGFFGACFAKELRSTISENTLFRNDSAATKTASAYLRYLDLHSEYLKKTLMPLITIVQKDPHIYEADEGKKGSGSHNSMEKAKLCEKNLLDMATKFVDAILNSQQYMPPQMHELLYCVRTSVAAQFPGSELKAVNGMLFLRFICPAIFSPDGFGLFQSAPKPEVRRALILVAKTVQGFVNSVQSTTGGSGGSGSGSSSSGSKGGGGGSGSGGGSGAELKDIGPKLLQFLDSVAKKPKESSKDGFEPTEPEKIRSMELVVKNLRANFAKIEELALADPRISVDPALAVELKLQVDEIRPLLGA